MIKYYDVARRLEALWIRIGNKFYCISNRMKFSLLGIRYGKRLVVHGHVRANIGRNAEVSIGDNFCFLSGRTLNPLSRNIQGSICVNNDAKLIIGNNVGVSSVVFRSHKCIQIGNHVDIGANTVIMDSDAHSMNYLDRRDIHNDMANKKDKPVSIGNDVLIGMNCMILKGVSIGDRCVVGAGSVVTRSVPNDCIVAGNPAKIIKSMNQNHQHRGVEVIALSVNSLSVCIAA